jgi:hypothetical protein
MQSDYLTRDRAVWERIFSAMPPAWYDAPPSNAMNQCRAYFAAHPCARLLDLMRVVYDDAELSDCLSGWWIERFDTTAERFRVIEATFQG